MKVLSLLIKPVSGTCNINCTYCFYRKTASRRKDTAVKRMPQHMAEQIIRQSFDAGADLIQLAFQGGEPMLAGIEFFKSIEHYISLYQRNGVRVERSIQTNGTLITEEWSRFFRENGYLVGISLDGTEQLQNMFRLDYSMDGTYRQVSEGFQMLRKACVPVNTLSVVTEMMCTQAKQVYESLKSTGVRFMQFIPCMEFDSERDKYPYSLNMQHYGQFMKELFDCWYEDYLAGEYVSIRTFDDYIHLLAGQQPGACSAAGQCGRYLVIEADGRVYPCDFFSIDEFCLGSMETMSLKEIVSCMNQSEFANKKCISEECMSCLFYSVCRGGCRKDYNYPNGTGKNRFCEAYKLFFSYTYPRMLQMAAYERTK